MSTVGKKHNPKQKAATVSDLFATTTQKIKSTHTEELVIALCGPVGSPLHKVSEKLKKNTKIQF